MPAWTLRLGAVSDMPPLIRVEDLIAALAADDPDAYISDELDDSRGVVIDGRFNLPRVIHRVFGSYVAKIATANAHLERALAHLDSDDPMAASHAAAEVRNAQRVLELGEQK